ncbi:MAG: hypothetical protein GY799_34250 [Desulfobulbaceae bacterium]|nr:hypothetical protein [Desulfobulbaceae bacterium]
MSNYKSLNRKHQMKLNRKTKIKLRQHLNADSLLASVRCGFEQIRVPLNKSHQDTLVNFIEYWEENTTTGKIQRFCWITDFVVTDENVFTIMRGGRVNSCTQKTGIYGFFSSM